jgi:hypothetical protein
MNLRERLLRDLAAHDERSLQAVLSCQPCPGAELDRTTFSLVQLSALLALDAGIESLRWAVDRAAATGVDDAALAQVLLSSAFAASEAQAVVGATQLAAALGVDVEPDADARDGR